MLKFFFFFKQKTAYEMLRSLVGSEMCIRDRRPSGGGRSRRGARGRAGAPRSLPPPPGPGTRSSPAPSAPENEPAGRLRRRVFGRAAHPRNSWLHYSCRLISPPGGAYSCSAGQEMPPVVDRSVSPRAEELRSAAGEITSPQVPRHDQVGRERRDRGDREPFSYADRQSPGAP